MDNYDQDGFKDLLVDEYKILQDKIDKIGAFRFTIKGWSITAVIAASAAASGRGFATVFGISLGLVLMLFFFFVLEYEQVRSSRLFGARAGRLEDAFRKINIGKGAEVYASLPVPYTAHELVLAGHRVAAQTGTMQTQAGRRAQWVERYQVARQTHIWLYLILVVLALIPLLPHHRAIHDHWTRATEKIRTTLTSHQHEPQH